jgi:hypothetical protein
MTTFILSCLLAVASVLILVMAWYQGRLHDRLDFLCWDNSRLQAQVRTLRTQLRLPPDEHPL